MSFARSFVLSASAFALFVGLVAGRPAEAGYTAVTTVDTSHAQTIEFIYKGHVQVVYATAFQTKLYDSAGKAASGTFNTYCVDVTDELKGRESVDLAGIGSLAGGYGSYVGSLYANFAATAVTPVQQAALQLAIWKTEYDGPACDFKGGFGLIAASQAVIDQALYYLSHNTPVDLHSVCYLQVNCAGGGQSLIGPGYPTGGGPPPAAQSVPEPASIALVGIGLVASVGAARRRRVAA